MPNPVSRKVPSAAMSSSPCSASKRMQPQRYCHPSPSMRRISVQLDWLWGAVEAVDSDNDKYQGASVCGAWRHRAERDLSQFSWRLPKQEYVAFSSGRGTDESPIIRAVAAFVPCTRSQS